MIKIKVDKSNKCNGDYSLFISFPYDMKIVSVIREFPTRYWNGDNKEWELPLNRLGSFIDSLSNYEFDIQGSVDAFKPKTFEMPTNFQFKTTPFNHQIEGFNFGLENDRWLLGDEQGCVSGESFVKIRENNKKATRNIRIKYLKEAFENDNTIKIKSLVNGRFAYMPIKAVVDKGIQKTLELHLENTSIQCTPDHLIYTENGWVEADKIKVGDKVFTNGIQTCPLCGTTENLITYKYSKFFGYCKSCMYKSRNGKKYNDITKKIDSDGYVRLFGIKTRTMPNYDKMYGMGIYEHHQVWYENTGHIVDTSIEVVHHKNEIKSDNRFENLQLLTISEHDKLHSDTKTKHLYQFNENLEYVKRNGTKIYLVPKLQKVTNKTYLGDQQVWDVAIDDDTIHNFICNNIIVHNCGKTKQVIDIAVAKKLQKGFKHCLIICGVNGLKWNWINEIKTHSNESGYILGQRRKGMRVIIDGNKAKLEDINNLSNIDSYFIVTNVESFRNTEIADGIAKLCTSGEIGLVAIDEIHRCKDPSSLQGKGILKIQPQCRIAMTGTPLMNTPLDLYIILKWLGYEKHAYYSFKKHYCEMGGFGGYQIIGYKNLNELQEQLDDIMLRRLKNDVLDLPDKIFIDEYVEMSAKQAVIYKEVTNEIRSNIDQIKIAPNPLAQLIRMRQATGYTGILSSQIQESTKLDRMEELVEEAVNNGKQVVIFSNWTQMTTPAIQRLAKYNPAVITGETSDSDRQKMVEGFQNGTNKVIVGTIGAMGTGLTLTAGTVEIFLDEPWTMAAKNQAVDRCHRIGANENVTIYTLLAKDTIDERIHDIVYKKGAMSDALIDGQITGNKSDIVDYLLS